MVAFERVRGRRRLGPARVAALFVWGLISGCAGKSESETGRVTGTPDPGNVEKQDQPDAARDDEDDENPDDANDATVEPLTALFDACDAVCRRQVVCCGDEGCGEGCEQQCFFESSEATQTCLRLTASVFACWASAPCGISLERECAVELEARANEGCQGTLTLTDPEAPPAPMMSASPSPPEPALPASPEGPDAGATDVVPAAPLPTAPIPVETPVEPPAEPSPVEPQLPVTPQPDQPQPVVTPVEPAPECPAEAQTSEPPLRSSTGPSFAATVAEILDMHCTESCHEPDGILGGLGGFDEVQMSLALADSYATLTENRSTELPTMWLVGSTLEDSYLWHKLSGTQEQVCGDGAQMPITGELNSEQVGAIRAWIEGGASP
jgi:hypothetical protein